MTKHHHHHVRHLAHAIHPHHHKPVSPLPIDRFAHHAPNGTRQRIRVPRGRPNRELGPSVGAGFVWVIARL